MYKCEYSSPVGRLILESDGEYLTRLDFDLSGKDFENCGLYENSDVLGAAVRWLDLYFSGQIPDFTPKIRLSGTAFQRDVWEILLHIPYGQTETYGAIAKSIVEKYGIPKMSAQAVGNAIHRNPIAIIVPCHRVIGSNGNLTGYAGGLDRKAKLLNIEKGVTSQ